ncbi:MAG: hypothetical protein AAGG59_11890 [Bacteroidota bacterium]
MNKIIVLFAIVALLACEKRKAIKNEVEARPILPEKVLNVAFLVVDGVYNSELVAPMDILHHTVFHTEKGMRVFTVAPLRDTITSF